MTSITQQIITIGLSLALVTALTINGVRKLPVWLIPSITPHPVDCRVAGNDSFCSSGTTPCEQAIQYNKNYLLLINLHRHNSTLAMFLLSLMKLNRKNEPSTILPRLKKNSPFLRGNLVTNKSSIDDKELLNEKYATA